MVYACGICTPVLRVQMPHKAKIGGECLVSLSVTLSYLHEIESLSWNKTGDQQAPKILSLLHIPSIHHWYWRHTWSCLGFYESCGHELRSHGSAGALISLVIFHVSSFNISTLSVPINCGCTVKLFFTTVTNFKHTAAQCVTRWT